MIMDRLYGGVCYAGIDVDPELKYPKGMYFKLASPEIYDNAKLFSKTLPSLVFASIFTRHRI